MSLSCTVSETQRDMAPKSSFLCNRLQNGLPYAIGPLSVSPVCDTGVLWPNGWMDQDETWHGGRPRPQPNCVRWGPILSVCLVFVLTYFQNFLGLDLYC